LYNNEPTTCAKSQVNEITSKRQVNPQLEKLYAPGLNVYH